MQAPSTRPRRTLQRLTDRWLRDEGGRAKLIVRVALVAIFLLLLALAGGQDRAHADTITQPGEEGGCYAVTHVLGGKPVAVPCPPTTPPAAPAPPAPEPTSCTPAPAPEATPRARHKRHRRFAHSATIRAPR